MMSKIHKIYSVQELKEAGIKQWPSMMKDIWIKEMWEKRP